MRIKGATGTCLKWYLACGGGCSIAKSCQNLRPHGLQYVKLPCPSPSPWVCSDSCPLSRWCHPTISSSVIPFPSCLQSFPALGSFPVSQFLASGGHSIGVSVSASVLPANIQGWFPLELTGVWSPCCPGDSQASSPTPQSKSISSLELSLLYGPTLTSQHDYWENQSFDYSLCAYQDSTAFASKSHPSSYASDYNYRI